MLDLFENFHKYIPDDKFDSIIACIKEEKEESAISAILKTFMKQIKINIITKTPSHKQNTKMMDLDKTVI